MLILLVLMLALKCVIQWFELLTNLYVPFRIIIHLSAKASLAINRRWSLGRDNSRPRDDGGLIRLYSVSNERN
jgi:hypothetical protein